MLIETEILFTDVVQSDLMGHEVNKSDSFIFELTKVSGIMPGDETKTTSIIFLEGKDVLINLPFIPLLKKYKEAMSSTSYFSPETNEG